MQDEHAEFVAKLEAYLKDLETIASEARAASHFDSAREAVRASVQLLTSIQSVKAWFTDNEQKSSVAERIMDKSLS